MRTGGLNVQTSRAHEGSTLFKGMEGLVDGKAHPDSKTNKVSVMLGETTQDFPSGFMTYAIVYQQELFRRFSSIKTECLI